MPEKAHPRMHSPSSRDSVLLVARQGGTAKSGGESRQGKEMTTGGVEESQRSDKSRERSSECMRNAAMDQSSRVVKAGCMRESIDDAHREPDEKVQCPLAQPTPKRQGAFAARKELLLQQAPVDPL
ncbi:uncharacterized protein SPSK_08105 [Sporothrix schenckii 1099-18]|uniref:Uncharacterized protein n=1 Tax=Sporothrix schenckii 1099-18 TaxID=1397361 RepID=A0A0F2MDV6_SPOSC|nr:uncharacterized protein SPSK_08105 [Sporothrix schenckii 1099-18]KJR87873.1 hypothetical protein SPSK_08105 [Sporothrix schenckii 1099-18]